VTLEKMLWHSKAVVGAEPANNPEPMCRECTLLLGSTYQLRGEAGLRLEAPTAYLI